MAEIGLAEKADVFLSEHEEYIEFIKRESIDEREKSCEGMIQEITMRVSFEVKILSSLQKVFLTDDLTVKPACASGTMLKNETYSFQVAYRERKGRLSKAVFKLSSPLMEHLKIYRVESVPCQMPAYPGCSDSSYISTKPGLYPDILIDYTPGEALPILPDQARSLWLTLAGELPAGIWPIDVEFLDMSGEVLARDTFTITIIDKLLPPQRLLYTNWFHCDCLASWYGVKVFSPRHWEIIDNYMRATARYGKNMILTPVFTPPLDTAPGTERLTVQLVDITCEGNEYYFNFDRLNRWIDLAQAAGITHFEIAHFFTQWGAAHAPKIIATANGTNFRLFGWETEATDPSYTGFLRTFLPELLAFLRTKGVDKRCYFHISDEPSLQHLPNYLTAKSVVADLLADYPIIDALSDFELYQSGAVERPVPANNHIAPFLEHEVPQLWTYYCCGQNTGVSNRFIAQYSNRNRILGAQMFKFNIAGFLQWGYNFWYSQGSVHELNPFVVTDGEFFVPSGDAFTVYPGKDCRPLLSIRELVFYDGIQDMRAFQLVEERFGRERILSLIDEGLAEPLAFDRCPDNDEYILSLREKVNSLLDS